MAVSSTTTTKEQEQQEKKVSVDFFHIDMIPDAMEKMKWPVAAKLMRHWFDTKPSFSYTAQSKKSAQDADPTTLPESQINCDIIKMSWAIQYEQVKNGINELSRIWKSEKGIKRLKFQLGKKGSLDKEDIALGYSENIQELDANAQVNILVIGSKFDTVNEWYGAMGNSTLKVCIRGKTSKSGSENIFTVDKLGFYLKDTYDFVDEGKTPEPLGIWSKNRILDKTESALYMSTYLSGVWGVLARDFTGFVPVFNADFRKWQTKHNTGGDFIVLSDVLWLEPLPKDKVIVL
ncbi:hypothetical protein AM387_21615 [Klebsiella pneumoniae]|uniref:DUF6402 family protein n=1 Tax=Klebsiella TaxID=570 RepID=UPI0003BE389B|nr:MULTISPECIES: DUF6402 family protein [Klebsiella]EIV2087138.1 hypothetical protein [Klebsiella pneumoniae subsp. ozaenae]AOA94556.1 hypothetical protein A8C02_03755 [Klebsiella pneumoniae]AWC96362.1 hypothetical protein AM388_01125 [Klebsiella pneumoniae]AWD94048.1 hypothetical protein AM389_01180 [Klebsiella pneumoniae]AWS85990.1 hypothetical protein AM387_21615 [Klebsiella pneumoniae]